MFGKIHFLGDDHDACGRDIEQAAVLLPVEADFHALGDHHVLVDDAAMQPGARADAHVREDDRVGDVGVVVDEHARADDRPFDVRPRHDRTLREQRAVDERRLAASREILLAARAERIRPGRDDKVLADLIIGKQVEGREGQYYVRKEKQDVVYQVEIDLEKFSTDFGNWIEKDLLQMRTSAFPCYSLFLLNIPRVKDD